ncbi:MAG: DUF3006 domain-containing protein [Clostridium sp.]
MEATDVAKVMSEYFIVDRINGENVTVEAVSGEMIIINKKDINEIPKEGYVLTKKDNMFVIDIDETKARKDKINKIMKGMWQE